MVGVAQLAEHLVVAQVVARSTRITHPNFHGGCSSAGRTPGCGPGCRAFNPRHSPHLTPRRNQIRAGSAFFWRFDPRGAASGRCFPDFGSAADPTTRKNASLALEFCMDKLVIEGGVPLKGRVRVSGSKNAALPDRKSTV